MKRIFAATSFQADLPAVLITNEATTDFLPEKARATIIISSVASNYIIEPISKVLAFPC
ncbi:MAG: hypothetical protein AB7F40_00675 [Victivallaceae bacterium]